MSLGVWTEWEPVVVHLRVTVPIDDKIRPLRIFPHNSHERYCGVFGGVVLVDCSFRNDKDDQ